MIEIDVELSEPVVHLDIECTLPPAGMTVPVAFHGAFDAEDVPHDEYDWAFDE